MISRLVICFSLSVALAISATVRGKISIEEPNGKHAKALQLSSVVIWLNDGKAESGTFVNAHAVKAKMLQKNKTFTPHVLAIPIGSTVEFPNADPIFHNAFSNYNGQIFDIGLYPPGSTRSVKFQKPGVVRVFCNIHASMSAVIVVLSSPWFATSDSEGLFEIEDVPEGIYRLGLYYERATEQALSELQRTVPVGSETVDLGTIPISESGYLSIPHLNKYGKPYPSAPSDPGAYPGARP
ncbi:MAG: methylamine utilization protein [Bryobacteraceae bacterium]